MTPATAPTARSARSWVPLLIATCLVAANMRMTITGVGSLLEEIADDRGVPTAALGALGSVPLAAWALVSPLGHWLSARIGMSNGVSLALVVLAGGTVWRSLPGSPLNLWIGTAFIGAGLAIANVLMPASIKRDFPGHVPAVMGVYTALLSGVGAVAAGVVVPLSAVRTPSGGAFGWEGALLLTGALLPIALVVRRPERLGCRRRLRRWRMRAAGGAPGAVSGAMASRGSSPSTWVPNPCSTTPWRPGSRPI